MQEASFPLLSLASLFTCLLTRSSTLPFLSLDSFLGCAQLGRQTCSLGTSPPQEGEGEAEGCAAAPFLVHHTFPGAQTKRHSGLGFTGQGSSSSRGTMYHGGGNVHWGEGAEKMFSLGPNLALSSPVGQWPA